MPEHKKIVYPFCEKGEIETLYFPATVRFKKGTWGGSKPGVIKSAERFFVLTQKCPNCGKSAKEIKRKLECESKPIPHQELLERLRKAGLPTRV